MMDKSRRNEFGAPRERARFVRRLLLAVGVVVLVPGVAANEARAQSSIPAAPTAAAPSAVSPAGGFHRYAMVQPPLQPASVAAAPIAHLSYYGGPVMSNANVVEVVYGTSGTFVPEVLASGYPSIGSFTSAVFASPHVDWLSEYNSVGLPAPTSNQRIGRARFADKYTVAPLTADNGAMVNDSQVQAELIRLLDLGQLPAPTFDATGQATAIYSVFFRHGQQICDDSPGSGGACSLVSGGFCAYHGSIGYHGRLVPYSVQPDLAGATGCGGRTGTPTDFERTTTVFAHEVVEAVTDPYVAEGSNNVNLVGWYDINQPASVGGEIGDICNGLSGTVIGSDGHSYTTQREWSNVAGDCIITRAETNDFFVSVPGAAVTASPGSQVSVPVTVTGTNGTPGPVTLSVAALPAGVTAAVSPATVSPGGTAHVVVTVGPSAVNGTSLVVVTGQAGSLVRSAAGALTVSGPYVPPPGSALDVSAPVGRLADTRTTGGPLAPGAVLRVHPAGSGLTAAVLNVTAVSTTAPGYLTAWPCDAAMPGSSSLNVDPGRVVPNLVTVALGASGDVCVFNGAGTTHVAVDQMASYRGSALAFTAGRLVPLAPVRALDTRLAGSSAFAAGEVRSVDLKPFGVPTDASAVALGVTLVNAPAGGYWTVWGSGGVPTSSNLNADHAGQTVANQVIVPATAGQVQVLGSAGGHLLIDVVGYFTGASAPTSGAGIYHPITPVRASDSRVGGRIIDDTVDLSPWVPSVASAVTLNATVTQPAAGGYLTVYPAGGAVPNVSNVNYTAGQTIADHVLSGSPGARISYHSYAPTHVVIDLSGWYA